MALLRFAYQAVLLASVSITPVRTYARSLFGTQKHHDLKQAGFIVRVPPNWLGGKKEG